MNKNPFQKFAVILFITLCITSCTDPKTKEKIAELQMANDSLTTLLQSAENCCECGDQPADLIEIEESIAREAWNRYKTESKTEKILGTWLDKENNWYLYCIYKSNIYSGIGLNEAKCPMVVYAVQLVTEKDTTYKYFALNPELTDIKCSTERKAYPHSGTCPNRCP